MLKDFKARLYQETIFATTVSSNTLVVLPTGMGKTAIALMLGMQRLKQYPNSKILILAPTKPLVEQIMQVFKEKCSIDSDKIVMFTGTIKPEKRQEMWKDAQIIISTPQGLENDIISNRISLKDVSLAVFDEAHRAVKDYSYVWVCKQYNEKAIHPRILALTASPGADLDTINSVCDNLFIEKIEIRTDKDPDVAPYIQDVKLEWKKVVLPLNFKEIQKILIDCTKSKMQEIIDFGIITNISIDMSKKDMLGIQSQLRHDIMDGNRSLEILRTISLMAEIMKISHGLELLETQGISALYKYLSKIERESYTTKTKATINLAKDVNFKSALDRTKILFDNKIEHPKLDELRKVIEAEYEHNKNVRIIVFNQYRDSAKRITEEMNSIENISSELFVGQAKKNGTGLSQKKQIEMLNRFRNDEFNVLVSSSVGEEGLDIPQVDIVIFFEPIPSAVRTIQRRGRTGRLEKGKVIILLAQGTRDEAYRWSAHHKENRMYRNLELLKKNFRNREKKKIVKSQTLLSNFEDNGNDENNIKIHIDYREKGSPVIKELIETGCEIKLEKLDVADYVLSDRCAVEYKKQDDFINSLFDGRLMEQLKSLKDNYSKPIILIEGERDIYTIKNVHPNVIRGMLATITVSYGIPILFSKDFKDSAAMLSIIAKREQKDGAKNFSLHGSLKPKSLKQQQEYLISALPGIGTNLSIPLLKEFKNVKNIVNASVDDLKKIDKIGEIKAKNLKHIFEEIYED